ncbi:unnamed protein product, partial [Heterotrigona itama]
YGLPQHSSALFKSCTLCFFVATANDYRNEFSKNLRFIFIILFSTTLWKLWCELTQSFEANMQTLYGCSIMCYDSHKLLK